MIAQPKPFECPACLGPIFYDWKNAESSLQHWETSPEYEYWSDGVLTGANSQVGSIVACPLCACVFPYFSVLSIDSENGSGAANKLAASTPFLNLGSNKKNNSKVEPDFDNIVRKPDWKLFRFLGSVSNIENEFDFLFTSLIVESVLQTFNDRDRARVRRGEPPKAFIGETTVVQFLEEFASLRRRAGSEGTMQSYWAGFSTYEFMGSSRYFFLEAEIERLLGSFDFSQVILESLIEDTLPLEARSSGIQFLGLPLDRSVEYPAAGPVNWELSLAFQRIDQIKELNSLGVRGLRRLVIR